MDEQKRIIGKIIKISTEGWGFLSSRDIEFTRIFFHWTALKQDTLKFQELKMGMKCEFIPVEFEGRGWRALQIKVIESRKHEVSTLSEHGQEDDGQDKTLPPSE